MTTAQLLNSDLCSLRAWYAERWKPPFLTPRQILIEAVEHGLMAEGDAGEAAEAKTMDLCVNPGIDTAETDLLALASHISSFANFLAWLLRGQQAPWNRPETMHLSVNSVYMEHERSTYHTVFKVPYEQESEGSADLSHLSRGTHERLAESATSNFRAANEDELPQLHARLHQTWTNQETTMREVRLGEVSGTSRGLQQATQSDVAVPRVPFGAPSVYWQSGAFIGVSGANLRRIALVDRWDGWCQSAIERSWDVLGECSVYQCPMDILVVEIGKLRKGHWSNPFIIGYRHPIAKTLRFKRRGGENFSENWNVVEREHDWATREEWLDSLTEDGVLADLIHVYSVGVPENRASILELAQAKLARLRGEKPEENLTACFDRINPCPYRSCCPRGFEPSNEMGFVAITSFC